MEVVLDGALGEVSGVYVGMSVSGSRDVLEIECVEMMELDSGQFLVVWICLVLLHFC